MTIENNLLEKYSHLLNKASKIKLVLSDCDGVLTDGGVYYTSQGEAAKRFFIRDGMGVKRLRDICNIETGILTGELSASIKTRAEKLKIKYLYLGIDDKPEKLIEILNHNNLKPENIAYIGDDVNDIEVIKTIGLSACPKDAFINLTEIVDFVSSQKGGNGAFREFAELIISLRTVKI